MTNDYKFFHEFFDGQIVKPESQNFKMFKIFLFSAFLSLGLAAVIAGYSTAIPLLVLAVGMLWNVYVGLDSKVANVCCILVAFLYFYVACNFSLYANCLIYIACYIPLQQIAVTKDYSEGNFVQIKKYISDTNRLLLFILALVLMVVLALFDFAVGANFVYIDAISAGLLVCSAVLRNERYFEYYFFRFAALISSIILWILVAIEYGTFNSICIILMYISYLIFDVAMLVLQKKTYTNQFLEKQKQVKKIETKKKTEDKLAVYEKMQKSK